MYTNNNPSTFGMSNFVGHQQVLHPIFSPATFNSWRLESFKTNKAQREAGFITNFSISEQGRYKRLIKAYARITGRKELHIVHDAYDVYGHKLNSDYALYWCSDATIKDKTLVWAMLMDITWAEDDTCTSFNSVFDTNDGFYVTQFEDGIRSFYERVVRLYNDFCGKEVFYIAKTESIFNDYELFCAGNRNDVNEETLNNFWIFASRACSAICSRVAITSEMMKKYPAGLKALEKAI